MRTCSYKFGFINISINLKLKLEFNLSIILSRLIQIDQEWVPHSESSSLYIRPTLIGTEGQLGVAPAHEAELFVILSPVGPYFSTGVKPVNLVRFVVTNTEYVLNTKVTNCLKCICWKFSVSPKVEIP